MPTIQRFLIQEDEQDKTVELTSLPFTIGRARDCDFVLDHTEISRLHARCSSDHLNIYLEDMGSTNGTLVNERRLEEGESYRLRAGDTVRFAQICTWVFDDPVTTAHIDPVQLTTPGMTLDRDTACVSVRKKRLHPPLSPNQFALLMLLYDNAGRIISREEICEHVWEPDQNITDQTLDALVSRLRKRLLEIDPEHDYIVTRRGFGLMFQNRS